MTAHRALMAAVVIGLALLVATAAFEVVTYVGLQESQSRQNAIQRTFAVSQKASAKTRVSTVSQRCDLTGLILGVLIRVHDRADITPFQASEATCLKQLALVKKINATTPSPPKP